MNGLHPKERELLTMLAEEAGEIVQAVTKILRHGPDSYNPDNLSAGDNTEQLRKEVVDMLGVIQLMRESYSRPLLRIIAGQPSPEILGETMRRKMRWMHNPPCDCGEDHEDPTLQFTTEWLNDREGQK